MVLSSRMRDRWCQFTLCDYECVVRICAEAPHMSWCLLAGRPVHTQRNKHISMISAQNSSS